MTVETKASKEMGKRLDALEPGSPRFEVLEVARRFKTSWVELGAKLFDVRRRKMHEEWGYPKFDDYCRDEIRIKPQTAAKLTSSYGFLKEEEPAVLRRDGVARPVPDIQVVDFLRRMKEREVPEQEYARLREMALEEDASPPELRREAKPFLPRPEPPSLGKLVRGLVQQAERLANALASVQGVPHVVVKRALDLVSDLKALVKEE